MLNQQTILISFFEYVINLKVIFKSIISLSYF